MAVESTPECQVSEAFSLVSASSSTASSFVLLAASIAVVAVVDFPHKERETRTERNFSFLNNGLRELNNGLRQLNNGLSESNNGLSQLDSQRLCNELNVVASLEEVNKHINEALFKKNRME